MRESWDMILAWTQDKIISSAASTEEDPDSIFPLLLIKQVQTDINLLPTPAQQASKAAAQGQEAGSWLRKGLS